MSLYEELGREADRAAHLHAEYRKVLAVLDLVARGVVAPSRVAVDLVAETWALNPPPPSPLLLPTTPPE